MASHGDIAEGGANDEFNDIIKWRSGMFLIDMAIVCVVVFELGVFIPLNNHTLCKNMCP